MSNTVIVHWLRGGGRDGARARWVLLAIVAIGMLAPWLDPGLNARPYHQHIVRGGAPEQQARALTAHQAAHQVARKERPQPAAPHEPTVSYTIVVSVTDDASALETTLSGTMPVLADSAQHLQPPELTVTAATPDRARTIDDVVPAVPTHPPRVAAAFATVA